MHSKGKPDIGKNQDRYRRRSLYVLILTAEIIFLETVLKNRLKMTVVTDDVEGLAEAGVVCQSICNLPVAYQSQKGFFPTGNC